ncbi:MAG: hypothetical protein AAF684_01955, partial [Pseudomonadota bacterium]
RAAVCAILLAAAGAAAQDGEVIEGRPVALDGDTLRFGALKVSLNGVDAPEFNQSCRDETGTRYLCGRAARDFIDGLLAGRDVRCRLFSRIPPPINTAIGVCETDQGDLSQAMIDGGWALPYGQAGLDLQGAAGVARAAGVGLFAGTFQLPAAWRRGYGLQGPGAGQGPCVIKGNLSPDGRRYFTPHDPDYLRVTVIQTNGERWFCTVDEAIAAGWTQPGPRCVIKGVVEDAGRRVYYLPTDRFFGEITVEVEEGGRVFCTPGEANQAGFRNCLIKGVVEEDGRRVYYVPNADGYLQVNVERAQGDRWLCTVEMARSAGFLIAAPLDPEVTRRPAGN